MLVPYLANQACWAISEGRLVGDPSTSGLCIGLGFC
jgi:hypothetical protein